MVPPDVSPVAKGSPAQRRETPASAASEPARWPRRLAGLTSGGGDAEVRLVGWEVVLVPRADTLVLAPGTERWVPARLDEPVPLPDGTRVAIGSRTFTVHLGAAPAGR